MQMKLSPDQGKKFETILWLTDPFGGRGTGRTELLALAYIQHSINYRTWVSIVNHGIYHRMSDKELIDRILGIVHSIGGYTVKIRKHPQSICVEPIPPKEERSYSCNPFIRKD